MTDTNKSPIGSFFYNHNPFYAISAGVILFGLQSNFPSDLPVLTRISFTNSVLVIYTIVLAIIAYAIVRFGKVWDDARTIFMILLLLFSALSINLDGLWSENPVFALGLGGIIGLVIFGLTEGLLIGLKIRFPLSLRMPYYFLNLLILFYPAAFTAVARSSYHIDPRALILLFPVAGSLGILMLLAVVHSNFPNQPDNGTPWKWPMFPLSPFAVLTFLLLGRCLFLSMSFQPVVSAATPFTPFLWTPVLLTAGFVGVVSVSKFHRSGYAKLIVLSAPMILFFCSEIIFPFTRDPLYRWTNQTIGSPFWLSLIGLGCFFLVSGRYEKVLAPAFLKLNLLLLMGCSTNGYLVVSFEEVAVWPIPLILLTLLATAEQRSRSANWMVSAFFLNFFVCHSIDRSIFHFDHLPGGYLLPIAVSSTLMIGVISLIFNDAPAKATRVLLAFALPVISIGTLMNLKAADSSLIPKIALISTVCLAGFLFSWTAVLWKKSKVHLLLSFSQILIFGAYLFKESPLSLDRSQQGIALTLGLTIVLLGIGVLISCTKAGARTNFKPWLDGLLMELSIIVPKFLTPAEPEVTDAGKTEFNQPAV